jgi:hypothetical protein
MVTDDIEFRPISIPKATMDLLLKQERPDRLIVLYVFYYYTAIWQKTNQPKVTKLFAAKALKWKKETVSKYKQELTDLGLVKSVKKRDKSNRIVGHFTKVKFYPKRRQSSSKKDKKQKTIVPPNGPKNHRPPNGASGILNAYSNGNIYVSSPFGSDTPGFDDKIYREWADKLHQTINAANKLKRKSDSKEWIKQFRKLHKDDGATPKRIKRVLNWLCKNYGKKYVPAVFSAITFRDKFLRIENVMKIDKEKKAVKKVKLTKTPRAILKEVEDLSWPKGASRQLPRVIVESFGNYKRFLKINMELRDKYKKRGKKQSRLFAEHLDDSLYEPQEYIVQYMTNIHHNIIDWQAWSGNLSTYIWKYDCDYFDKECAQICEDYSGDSALWDKHRKRLQKASTATKKD